ncbi:MAG TPA: helix-turn-helix transcriptional regulator [Victivallales bacterium]|nr:helix-turn-helix transcriptional regulator [Victivallales bacterium]HPO90148.1 helix-turn-helix transcriptional regulator [Victivallales bacterium]HRR28776.1 helix-turn-helix transcriptional regulator [Victivallales bacterium]
MRRIWEVRADSSYDVKWTANYPHSGLIILRTFSGAGEIKLNKGRRIHIPAQSFLLLEPSTINSYKTVQALWSFIWIEINEKHLFEIPHSMIFPLPLIEDEIANLSNGLALIGREELSEVLAENKLCGLILDWISRVKFDRTIEKRENSIARKIAMLISKSAHPLRIVSLSKEVALSESRMRQIFKAKFSMSPKEYYTNIRMSKAMYWLRNTDMKLSEISERLSYSNQYHLSREFKKFFGSPPSRFRPLR